jgi:hypothetical protein
LAAWKTSEHFLQKQQQQLQMPQQASSDLLNSALASSSAALNVSSNIKQCGPLSDAGAAALLMGGGCTSPAALPYALPAEDKVSLGVLLGAGEEGLGN